VKTRDLKVTLIIAVALVFYLTGCKTQRVVPSADYSNLPSDPYELGEYTRKNNSQYSVLTIKNFKVKYSSSGKTTTFYGSAKIVKDSLILVSLRAPLGIEMSRILMSEDSVKVLYRSDKRAILSDFSYLENILRFKVNFHIIENVLSGNLPKEYKFLRQKTEKSKSERECNDNAMYIGRYFNKLHSRELKYEACVHPELAKVSFMKFYRKRNFKLFDVQFSEYSRSDGDLFPGEIFIRHKNEDGTNTHIKVTISNFAKGTDTSVNFTIPSKYQSIRFK
jgi:hypothetical protein